MCPKIFILDIRNIELFLTRVQKYINEGNASMRLCVVKNEKYFDFNVFKKHGFAWKQWDLFEGVYHIDLQSHSHHTQPVLNASRSEIMCVNKIDRARHSEWLVGDVKNGTSILKVLKPSKVTSTLGN